MLARSYKTAEELGIDPEVYGALFEVRDRLDRGELVHWTPEGPTEYDFKSPPIRNAFNMATWTSESECGAVGCIGGWVELISGVHVVFDMGSELTRLFYPLDETTAIDNRFIRLDVYRNITPPQAVLAINNYLTTEKPVESILNLGVR